MDGNLGPLFPTGHRSIPATRLFPAFAAWAGVPGDPMAMRQQALPPTSSQQMPPGAEEPLILPQQQGAGGGQQASPMPIIPPISISLPSMPEYRPPSPPPTSARPGGGGAGPMPPPQSTGPSGPSRPSTYKTNPFGGNNPFGLTVPIIWTGNQGGR